MAEFLCKVSGVMSSNSEEEHRQDIIRNIIEEEGNGTVWWGPGKIITIEGPRAETTEIEVYVSDKKIGFVPEDKIADVMNNDGITDGVVTVYLL